MVEFGILGPLRLAVGDGDLDIGGAKRRGLVARLLVDANRVVPVDRIVEDLWPGSTPDEAKTRTKTVQTYVSQLRALLGADRVLRRSPGYTLVVQPGELDAERFQSLVARAGDAATPAEAIALLEEAERQWRGGAPGGVAAAPGGGAPARRAAPGPPGRAG